MKPDDGRRDPGSAMMAGLSLLLAIVIFALASQAFQEPVQTKRPVVGGRAPKTTLRTSPQTIPTPSAATWTRISWYWKYDPRASDYELTKVTDQFGCKWWVEIGNHLAMTRPIMYYESYRHRAYDAHGLPDCPKSAMPDPHVAYLTDQELKDADLEDMTIVSRTTVGAGDPGLVSYYRERRDEAAAKTSDQY